MFKLIYFTFLARKNIQDKIFNFLKLIILIGLEILQYFIKLFFLLLNILLKMIDLVERINQNKLNKNQKYL